MKSLSSEQKETLKAAIQDGLPLTQMPYQTIATALDLSEDDVIAQIQAWLDDGFIKRMGLIVRHHKVGYSANAMVVWNIADGEVDTLGELFRKNPHVTLCYRRPRRLPQWPYNLFCMIHGQDRSTVLDEIEQMVEQYGLQDVQRDVLFSQKQFKQIGGRYARTATRTCPG